MQIVSFAVHRAYLDPLTGSGVLVCPDPDEDLDPPGDPLGERVWLPSLGEYGFKGSTVPALADWETAIRRLYDIAWMPLEHEYGDPQVVGQSNDGRSAVGLYSEASIIGGPTLIE
ncbi:hypothetical protein ACQPXM_25140 [Kribbella sp. CA-253562]|uniref:hypothetical protein n=1 Tax=Kribbella sp. CA-253562 TaxID=3239942 RepID=UPI003D8FE4C7